MAAPDITNIPGTRQPVLAPDGTMDRVWYRFLFNLFNLTGAGSTPASIPDLLITPSLDTRYDPSGTQALSEVETLPDVVDLSPVYAAIQGLAVAPPAFSGTVAQIDTGTGLTGGPITVAGTIALADTAVTPGAYTSANITVDAQGRLTAAASGAGGSVTSITAGAGLTGGTITASGTVDIDFASANTWTARQIFNRPNTPVLTVATLPATPAAGDRSMVNDALAPAFGAAVAAGGAAIVPVYYSGAAWLVG